MLTKTTHQILRTLAANKAKKTFDQKCDKIRRFSIEKLVSGYLEDNMGNFEANDAPAEIMNAFNNAIININNNGKLVNMAEIEEESIKILIENDYMKETARQACKLYSTVQQADKNPIKKISPSNPEKNNEISQNKTPEKNIANKKIKFPSIITPFSLYLANKSTKNIPNIDPANPTLSNDIPYTKNAYGLS